MKNYFFAFFLLATFFLQAQHTISGTFTPAKEYKWLIAYRLKPGTQVYVADTAIKNGEFSLSIPENAVEGTYRLVYAIPQEEFYFDVIYNGKENIELTFDVSKGVSFNSSEENNVFNSYFKKINDLEREIVEFYIEGKTDENAFENIVQQLKAAQITFEMKAVGLITHQFILANKPFIPSKYEPQKVYKTQKGELF